jgi:hypothetical protein
MPTRENLREELSIVLNRNCAENGNNTPDFLLSEFLLKCLEAFDEAVLARDKWYGVKLHPVSSKTYKRGLIEGITRFAWWKDGTQFVGTCGTTLKSAIEEIEKEVKW